MQLHTIGIDLGKDSLSPGGAQPARRGLWCARSFSRKQLLHFTANLQVKLIGMEACGGSHFLGRAPERAGSRGSG